MNIYVDTETIGLNGPVKLIQYSVDRGPVQFIKIFGGPLDQPTWERLLEFFKLVDDDQNTFIGWNISFDLYHLYRLHSKHLSWHTPRPFACKVLDLYHHAALNGPFAPWAFSGKKVCRIRRVPRVALAKVAAAVEGRLAPLLPGQLVRHEHEVPQRPDLVTVSWTAKVSLGLKAHAEHWGQPVIKLADVWPLPPKDSERQWVLDCDDPIYSELEPKLDAVLRDDASPFFDYARKDIEYLWLAEDRLGRPQPNHHDTAAHVVAYTRFTGIPIDADVRLRTEQHYTGELRRIESLLAGTNLKSSVDRRKLIQSFDPIIQSTRKVVLEAIIKEPGHPAAETARAMLTYGSTKQKLDQVIKAGQSKDGRLHVDLRVLGTATGRMSGTGGFNVQGVGKVENGLGLRAALLVSAVGDFHQFEIAIAASAWKDAALLADLDASKDVHLATAITCHPKLVPLALSYEAGATLKKAKDPLILSARDQCKRVVFGIIYGCTETKVADVLGVSIDEARLVLERLQKLYPGVFEARARIQRRFCTADTSSWFKGSVAKMDDELTDMTGFTRRWSFERSVATVLWELGNEGIRTDLVGSIVRTVAKGPQAIDQAVRSALLGAAIAIQQAVYRQASNGEIQMPGANLTKQLQTAIWDKFHVPMLNVHDELVFPAHPNFDYKAISEFVATWTQCNKHLVKHLRFDLSETERWGDKG